MSAAAAWAAGVGAAGWGRPIGVHLDAGVARFVQGPAGGPAPGRGGGLTTCGGASAAAAVSVPAAAGAGTDPGADRHAAAAIRAAVAAYRFRGRRAVACLPASAATVQTLRLPPPAPGETAAELAGLVRFELADRLPFDPADAQFRHLAPRLVRRSGETVREVVAVAARASAATAAAKLLAAAGLSCVAVDVEPFAAFRGLCEPAPAPGRRRTARRSPPAGRWWRTSAGRPRTCCSPKARRC